MKKILGLFAFSTLFLSSCSSSDSPSSTASGPLVKTLIIDNINPGDQDYNLLFTYSGDKLINIKDSGDIIDQYVYTGDKLTRVNYPQDNTYILIEYAGSQVTKFTEYDPDFDSATKTVVTYSGNTFTRTVYEGDLTSQTTLSYTEVCTVQNGNITQLTRTSSFGSSGTETYTYDTKNNPFKNISNFTVFQVLDIDIEGNANNQTAMNYPGNPYTISITYNADNYPLTELSYDGSAVLKESDTYTYY
ncbi:hypothetical protein L1S35_09645 [Flavobacterium sp. AS60]|uniref:hypothetical protein n=1 Tax=Flavobacterium anseongense TaxID=2910677 RepID=UPI001F3D7EB0|nr:hypothetical protein [Flavobacterium sp. AS60]MCF6129939.1 hypothetical protein [Flavobacterium sp. AS60]